MLAIAVLALTANLAVAQTYTFPVKGSQGFSMTHKTRDGARISYQLGQFSLSQIEYRGEEMSEISINAISIPCDAGLPNLPVDSRLIAIPQGAKATLNVVHAETQTFQNVNIAPALRVQVENEEPDMNYVKDMKVYGKNAFFPENPFVIGESYIRGVNAVSVAITPFQYNPVTKELVVYTDVELSLSYEGGNGQFGDDRLRSPYWDPILAAELANYDQLPVIDYEARMQDWIRNNREGYEYLIIIPNNDGFEEPAQRLKEYRMQQGILTEVYRLDQIPASTTAEMKTWFHNAYNTWEIAPVAVLLFADHTTNMSQGIPAEEIYHSSSYGNCITDNQYADVTGDKLPEMVFARLVAANATEAAMMADKQIEYEYTNPNMDPNAYDVPITALGWQTERWFQLCSEVVGGYLRVHGKNPLRVNCIYDGTPGSSWSSNSNTSQVVDYFGPAGTNYIPQTPSELGGWDGGTPDQIVVAINQGTMLVQHRDHGLETGWGEPAFRNSHVAQLTNVGKMPFVFSINCLTGQFDLGSGPCFAEAFMRHTYNGQNAGAVGLICPTDVSYSFCNDALVWGVYDQFDPSFMPTLPSNIAAIPGPVYENRGNWRPAFGLVAGKYFLCESGWPYNTSSKEITYQMFTSHCDAFLRLYTEVPQTMTVNHQNVQLAGLNTFQITAPAGATIALTKGEGENLEIVAVAEGIGSAQDIEIPAQVPPTVLHLTVTGQNYLRYEADIDVIPAEGPYIIINSYELNNAAPQLNFGDETGFNLQLKNVGNSQAPAGTMTLSTDSEYITITSGTADFTSISSNQTIDLTEAFQFTVSDEVPNKTNVEFLITITSGDDVYENHIAMKAYAPVFEIGDVHIRELTGNNNGRLDPGETARLKFGITNKGDANSRVAEVNFETSSPYLNLLTDPTVSITTIPAGESAFADFDVYVGAAPSGEPADYTVNVASGVYTDNREFTSLIGLNVEDFELGTLDPSMWNNSATQPWSFSNENPYQGNFCLKSGAIGNNAETAVILTYEVTENDSIAFYYKVSSENNYDKLFFYIDNQEKNNWSGNVNWTRAQYFVTAGTHTFTWKYKKDSSAASGSDCAWIDYVILPHDRSLAVSAGLDITTCVGEPAQISGFANNQTSLEWTTAGDGTFDDATIMSPIYTPGDQDIVNGSVVLTITATNGTNTLSDDMTLSLSTPVSIENALTGTHYCAISEPQDIAVNVEGDYASFSWTTSGDGVFEDSNALSTTYTPGPQDIENGVTLIATAVSSTCGPDAFQYPFEMTPSPNMTMGLIPPCAFDYCQGQDIEMPVAVEFSGFIDGQLTIVINGESYPVVEGEPFLLPTANLEPGYYSFDFQHLSNGVCETDLGYSFSFGILAAPGLTVDETQFAICQGESVNIALHTSGGNPNLGANHFIVSGEGIEPIDIFGDSYTLTLTPTESTEIHLNKIALDSSECSADCETDLDITITVNVTPSDIIPVISGDNNPDSYLTPTSTYAVTNDVMVGYVLEPAEAGTLLPANDGLTVEVTWDPSYIGFVILKAIPTEECNTIDGFFDIAVKSSYDVNEIANSSKLYPNPTSGKVNIEAAGMIHVTIYNTVGQLVYDTDVDTDKLSVDMTPYLAGSYLVRIITNNGMCTKHLNVIR